MSVRRAVILFALALLVGARPVRPLAQSSPASLPRVFPNDLTYLGSFSLPDSDGRGTQLAFGGDALGLSTDGRTLYFSCIYGGAIAQVEIPAIGQQARVTTPCEAVPNLRAINPSDPNNAVGGVLSWNGRVIVSGYSTYDAAKLARTSHFAGASTGTLRGPVALGTDPPGMVAGYMGVVPAEWRSALRGAALSGQCCISIISRSSYGPSVSVFDPSPLDGTRNVASTMLVGYPEGHTTLGPFESSGPFYGGATRVGGVAFPAGTRSVLFVGRVGTTYCYGHGTTDRRLDNVPDGKGSRYCYDPTSDYQGTHGYPYKHQIWAYDAADLAAVARGERAPWDVTPYAAWALTEMSPAAGVAGMHGATYDPAARRLYVTTTDAPVVHVYEVAAGVSGVPTEVCGDGLDNDGNGQVDEGCPPPDTGGPSPPPPPPGETPGGGTGDGGRGGETGDGGETEDPDAPPSRRPPHDGEMQAGGAALVEVTATVELAPAGATRAAVAACADTVHVAYGDAALHYRQSSDGGRSWHDAVSLGDGHPTGAHALACDDQHVALAVRRDGALWIWTSADGGDSWHAPSRLADEVSGDVAVAVHDASVSVVWSTGTTDGWRVEGRRGVDSAWQTARTIADGHEAVVPSIAIDGTGQLVAWRIANVVRAASPWDTGATALRVSGAGALFDASPQGPLVGDVETRGVVARVDGAGRLVRSTPVAAAAEIDRAEIAGSRVAVSWQEAGRRVVAWSLDGGASWHAAALDAGGDVALALAPDALHAAVVDDHGAVRYVRLVLAPE